MPHASTCTIFPRARSLHTWNPNFRRTTFTSLQLSRTFDRRCWWKKQRLCHIEVAKWDVNRFWLVLWNLDSLQEHDAMPLNISVLIVTAVVEILQFTQMECVLNNMEYFVVEARRMILWSLSTFGMTQYILIFCVSMFHIFTISILLITSSSSSLLSSSPSSPVFDYIQIIKSQSPTSSSQWSVINHQTPFLNPLPFSLPICCFQHFPFKDMRSSACQSRDAILRATVAAVSQGAGTRNPKVAT